MPAVVSSTERSSGGGTSDADGTLRWSRSSKNDRKRERISAAFTERESREVALRPVVCSSRPAFAKFRRSTPPGRGQNAARAGGLGTRLTDECLRAESTRAMDLEGLVPGAREPRPQPMPARERAVAAGMAVAYLGAAAIVGALVA